MPTTDWSDLNRDGRRIEYLIKICDKNIKAELKKTDPEIARVWGYMDRLNKFTMTKKDIAKIILKVDEVLKEAETDYLTT